MADKTEDKKEEKKDEKSSGGKWWEFYVVRYALGTVFGVLIVNLLVKSGLSLPFPDGSISEITKPEGLPLLLGYGLAYCYLASAPILVFHATRFSMRPTSFRWLTLGFLVASAVIAYIWSYHANKVSMKVLYVCSTLAIAMISFLIFSQGRALYIGLHDTQGMWKFYRKLDQNRRNRDNRELIDSYRHLREHGNAFFVVLLELVLGLCLFVAGKVSIFPADIIVACASGDIPCRENVSTGLLQTIILVLIWIIPAAVVWAIGCFLEAEFANDLTIGQSPPSALIPLPGAQIPSTSAGSIQSSTLPPLAPGP